MAAPKEMTRQELLEARDRVRQELQALRSPIRASDYFGSEPIIFDLENILAEIEAQLAERGQ